MPETSDIVHIQSALVCEDIRTEFNGKEILLGVYSSDIGATSIPLRVSLCLWLQLKPNEAASVPIAVRAFIQNGIQVLEAQGTAQFPNKEMASIAFGNINFEIQSEGHFVAEIKEGDREWRQILSLPIRIRSTQKVESQLQKKEASQ